MQQINSTHLLWALGLVFLFFVLFSFHTYRIYSMGLNTYYELKFKRSYVAGQVTAYREFRIYMHWQWIFTIVTGIAFVILASIYIKNFPL